MCLESVANPKKQWAANFYQITSGDKKLSGFISQVSEDSNGKRQYDPCDLWRAQWSRDQAAADTAHED